MTENYATTGIILAAGSSKRFGQNKLLANIDTKPVLLHAIKAFQDSAFIHSIILVISESIKTSVAKMVRTSDLDKVKNIVFGGKTRQESVKKALDFLKQNDISCSYVVIHDGARPLLDPKLIDKCIQGAVKHKAVALGIRPKDTIKQADTPFSKTIVSTPKRELLWAIQTPQAFQFDLIYEAHEKAINEGYTSTDDCALVENIGVNTVVVEGDYRNLKITTPEDISIAEFLYNNTP
jgi:2-C-methyl-D-erythritol 4-phosphate cytidylyltransferase